MAPACTPSAPVLRKTASPRAAVISVSMRPGACEHDGVGASRGAQAGGGVRKTLRQAGPGAETRKAGGDGGERREVGWDGAAVGGAIGLGHGGAGGGPHGLGHARHGGMIGADIAARIMAARDGGADKAGVFAGAVVVQRGGRLSGGGERPCGRRAAGPVGAAFQAGGFAAGLFQHGVRRCRVFGQAGVRGAGQGELRVGEGEAVSGALGEQGQGLQRLDGRAREDRLVRVAAGQHQAALRVGHGEAAGVAGLDMRAAEDFGQDHGAGRGARGPVRQGPAGLAQSSEAGWNGAIPPASLNET